MNSLVKNTTLRFSRRRADLQASYEPLDQSFAEDDYRQNLTTSRRKVTSVDNETKGLSYKRDRAKKRLIYLQSYNLGSGEMSSRKMLKSRKLNRAAVRVKSVAVSVVSFIRTSSVTVPSYKVKSVHVKSFEPLPDMRLKSEFVVNVEANNPNAHISLIYGKESNVTLWYRDQELSQGKLPSFRQGTNNISIMHVDMNGKSKLDSGIQETLKQDQKNRMVPMVVQVQAPITIVVGEYKLREFVVYVNCSLTLDSLSADKNPEIITSTYTIHATL
ncbi:hypothetical protein ACET3Z_020088 [Daucus carota]